MPGAGRVRPRARQHGSPVAVTRSGFGSFRPPIAQSGLGRSLFELSMARSPSPALERRRRLAVMARPRPHTSDTQRHQSPRCSLAWKTTSVPSHLLPTSVVGSHGLPGWVWLAREALEAGRLGALDVRELLEDATQAALLDQERAGIDVLTTGEMGRVRFIVGFYDRITGIPTLAAPRKLG